MKHRPAHGTYDGREEHGEERRCSHDARVVGSSQRAHVERECERDRAAQSGEPDHHHVLDWDPLVAVSAEVRERTERERVERARHEAHGEARADESPVPLEQVRDLPSRQRQQYRHKHR